MGEILMHHQRMVSQQNQKLFEGLWSEIAINRTRYMQYLIACGWSQLLIGQLTAVTSDIYLMIIQASVTFGFCFETRTLLHW